MVCINNVRQKMTKAEIENIARVRFKRSTVPDPRFSDSDVSSIEQRFECQLPEGFAAMRELIGTYCISGDHLPAKEVLLNYDWELKNNPNWTEDFIPFYAVGNGDYLCFRRSECPQSGVYYVAHDDPQVQRLHASFDDYLCDADWFS
jgi:hypothetical protein